MKSFSLASFFFIILFIINISCYNMVNKSTKYVKNNIDKIIYYVNKDDYKSTENEIKKVSKKIDNYKKIWLIFVNHQQVDNVEVYLKQSMAYAKQKANKIDLLASLNTVKFYINNIFIREKINLSNIF